jgi:hypothetical protein
MAKSSHKNIQMTERWRTEKCLPSAPSRHRQLSWHDAKHRFSVLAFVQADSALPS